MEAGVYIQCLRVDASMLMLSGRCHVESQCDSSGGMPVMLCLAFLYGAADVTMCARCSTWRLWMLYLPYHSLFSVLYECLLGGHLLPLLLCHTMPSCLGGRPAMEVAYTFLH